MTGKMAELEAAHRVLQKRTEVWVSLQTMSRDLTSSINLTELAGKIGKHACELCGADQAILYFFGGERGDNAVVLATIGWEAAWITPSVNGYLVFGSSSTIWPSW